MIPAPRDFLSDPSLFGHLGAEWVPAPTRLDAARTRAAKLQHDCVMRMRTHLSVSHLTQSEYADALGWRRGRLSRILLGQVWVPLLDLEEILDSFGESVATVSLAALPPERHALASRRLMAAHLISQGYTLVKTGDEEFTAYISRLRDTYPDIF